MSEKTINQIYLEKRLKILLDKGGNENNQSLVLAFSKNIESLGYIFSKKLFNHLVSLTEKQISSIYKEVIPTLKQMRGAHRSFHPMYPNFPEQVEKASNFELYFNAMVHYWSFYMKDIGLTDSVWLPDYEKDERFPLTEKTDVTVLNLGSREDFINIFTTLISAKTSISQSDKEIIEWFIAVHRERINLILPDEITSKEQLALLTGLLLKYNGNANEVKKFIKTPTDVLRVAVAFSGGDVSLADTTKFGKFKRSERRFLLEILDGCSNLKEDMLKYKNVWIRLGERLHPNEYSVRYPKSANAFNALRNDEKIITFNSKVESFLLNDEVDDAVNLLMDRPGDFARRLDHIIRLDAIKKTRFVNKFISVAEKVSTNVLLQLYTHFKTRSETINFRSVFPKGNLAKIHVLDKAREPIDQKFCNKLAEKIRNVLVKRFSKLDTLGKVFVDENLKNYLVPFSQRSASKALKTIVRGSKIPLDFGEDTIRFFIWWKNGVCRTDIDLSACVLDEQWNRKFDISYYNLKEYGGCHSGDITDAPNGASEFIDISINKVLDGGGRYIAMCVNSYTSQALCDLPECFAGWMARKKPQSGELYEPKTVKNKIDLASDTTVSIPLVIDCKERNVIWCDLSLKQRPTWNNVANNSKNISLVCRAMSELKKPNLYDLMTMHVDARGKLVNEKEKADVVFSSESTPFDIDTIVTKFI